VGNCRNSDVSNDGPYLECDAGQRIIGPRAAQRARERDVDVDPCEVGSTRRSNGQELRRHIAAVESVVRDGEDQLLRERPTAGGDVQLCCYGEKRGRFELALSVI
jgi:hypothetical protein